MNVEMEVRCGTMKIRSWLLRCWRLEIWPDYLISIENSMHEY